MSTSRPLAMAASAASVASCVSYASAETPPVDASFGGDPVAELIWRSEVANAALLRGEVDRYRSLITLSNDFVLMSPFGGTPSRGADLTEDDWQDIGRFF